MAMRWLAILAGGVALSGVGVTAAATPGAGAGCAVPDTSVHSVSAASQQHGAQASAAAPAAGACMPARLLAPRPLAILASPSAVIGRTPLALHVTTASHATVTVILRVHDAGNRVLYSAILRGTADAQGRFSGVMRVAYVPSKPTPAWLTIAAQTATASAVRTSSVLLVH
jgi:hypothetical protein